jgi:hypothetical protein
LLIYRQEGIETGEEWGVGVELPIAIPELLVMLLLQQLVIGGLFLMVIAMVMAAFYGRSKSLLQNWAVENDLEIVARQRRFLRRGPYLWMTSKGQDVYRVTVVCPDGVQRSAWVRCGGFFKGMFSDNVDVTWD